MKPPHISTKKRSGFSLVEIALALGIVGFSLAALLGLLATASNVNAESGRETVMVSMTSQIMTNLRAVPFDALWEAEPSADVSDSSASENEPTPSTYYFTVEGALLEKDNVVNNPDAVYVCTVNKTRDEASKTPGADELNPGRYNMLRLQLVYSWPINAPEANRQTHTIHASIARY
jgi:uncharacterized protein (TIGR02598 family)